jgi:hypothetical protein
MIWCLERGGTFSEGAAVAGHLRLVDLPLSPFFFTEPLSPFCFFFGHVFAVAPTFLLFRDSLVASCGCYINIVGRKPVLRNILPWVSKRERSQLLFSLMLQNWERLLTHSSRFFF